MAANSDPKNVNKGFNQPLANINDSLNEIRKEIRDIRSDQSDIRKDIAEIRSDARVLKSAFDPVEKWKESWERVTNIGDFKDIREDVKWLREKILIMMAIFSGIIVVGQIIIKWYLGA